MGDRSAIIDAMRLREEQLLEQVSKLTKELERSQAELMAARYEMRVLSRAHERVLVESTRVQAHMSRVAQDSRDSYYAKVAELAEAEARFRRERDQQRAEMGDERRVAEDRLESIIRDKLDIISDQIEEIREFKHRLSEVDSGALPD